MSNKSKSKSSLNVRVDDNDLSDIRYVVKDLFKYDQSDFTREAIKEKLLNEKDTLQSSRKRLALDLFESDLKTVFEFADYRAHLDRNKLSLLQICALIDTRRPSFDDKEFRKVTISSLNKAFSRIYLEYPEYYDELKAYIQSIVKPRISKQLFAKRR